MAERRAALKLSSNHVRVFYSSKKRLNKRICSCASARNTQSYFYRPPAATNAIIDTMLIHSRTMSYVVDVVFVSVH